MPLLVLAVTLCPVAPNFGLSVKAPLDAHSGGFALVVQDFRPGAHRALKYSHYLALQQARRHFDDRHARYPPYPQSSTCQKRPKNRLIKEQKRPTSTDIPFTPSGFVTSTDRLLRRWLKSIEYLYICIYVHTHRHTHTEGFVTSTDRPLRWLQSICMYVCMCVCVCVCVWFVTSTDRPLRQWLKSIEHLQMVMASMARYLGFRV